MRPTPAPRARRRRTAAAVLVALLAGAALTACGGDEEQQAVAGDVVDGRPGVGVRGADRPTEVVLPSGTLEVAVGDPVGRLDPDQTIDLVGRAAPGDGGFVPISWRYDTEALEDLTRFLLPDGDLEVALVESGRHRGDRARYPLPAPSPAAGKVSDLLWVAVRDDTTAMRLEITYDGLTQRVDAGSGTLEAGAASGMYDLPEPSRTTRTCPSDDWFPAEAAVAFDCEVGVPMLLPYADGEWAEAGTMWLVAALRTSLTQYVVGTDADAGGTGTAQYAVDKVVDQTTLDGARPTSVIERSREGGYFSGALVFEVSGEVDPVLDVQQDFELSVTRTSAGVRAPSSLTATAEGPVTLAR